jgi:hypothetical protein
MYNSVELEDNEEKRDTSQVLVELIKDLKNSKSIPDEIKQRADKLITEVQLELLNNQKDFYTKEVYELL